MGTWGPGLYANDTACDLKPAITAVARLPYDADALVALFVDRDRGVAETPDDPDYPTFWLVLADQLHRKGIDAPEVFQRACEIIDSGADAHAMVAQGLGPRDSKARAEGLGKLRARLAQPVAANARKTLKKPQKLLMHAGDVMVAPVRDGGTRDPTQLRVDRYCVRNPYRKSEDFAPVGWIAFVVLAHAHVFGYLAVYCVMGLRGLEPLADKPDPGSLMAQGPWGIKAPATCSRSHFRRMGLESVGSLSLDPTRIEAQAAPMLAQMEHFAIADVSLSNRLMLDPFLDRPKGRITALSDLI